MSVISRQMVAEPEILALLEPGEQVQDYVSVVSAMTTSGAVRVAEPGAPRGSDRPRRSAGRRVLGFFSGNWMPRWARGDLLERIIGGVAVEGATDSAGMALHAALRDGTGMVRTDRRLIVVTRGTSKRVPDARRSGGTRLGHDYAVTWSAPVQSLVAARRRGRLNGVGRVELRFRDGSTAAVVTGLLTTGAAGRLLRGLALPTS